MDNTVTITSEKEANIDAMREFAKRKGISVSAVNENDIEYLEFLKKLEEFEDECILARIEEGLKTKRVSRDKIFAILNR